MALVFCLLKRRFNFSQKQGLTFVLCFDDSEYAVRNVMNYQHLKSSLIGRQGPVSVVSS